VSGTAPIVSSGGTTPVITISAATTGAAGSMSAADKTKLDGVATNANNYVHPANHDPSIITQDASNRFVSDAEKTTWNGKASTTTVTTSINGLMAAADKSKLDGVATNANNYVHPATHDASMIVESTTKRFVSDTEKSTWNDKYTKAEVTNLISTVETNSDWKESVNTFDDIATTYPNPQDGWTVNVKDNDYTYRYTGSSWVVTSINSIPLATSLLDGKMSAADKTKLDGVATNANNYVHPATHAPSIITQDASNRFVTDTEKTTWNAKANTASPAFTGTPTAPTAAVNTNTTQVATTAFVVSNKSYHVGTTAPANTSLVWLDSN
jgi:hypothetical protein